MKKAEKALKSLIFILVLALLAIVLSQSRLLKKDRLAEVEIIQPSPAIPTHTAAPFPEPSIKPASLVPAGEPEVTYHLDGFTADDIYGYFAEVVLSSEYSDGTGDTSVVQKWQHPITYSIDGSPTEEDRLLIEKFTAELSAVYGFPGMWEVDKSIALVQITFCPLDELNERMGEAVNGEAADGAAQWWYDNTTNEIIREEICIRSDVSQEVRNSVILEEIVNGLGLGNDTDSRRDSVIYSGVSYPQELSDIDRLIIELLYNPAIRCGMSGEECRAVIEWMYR